MAAVFHMAEAGPRESLSADARQFAADIKAGFSRRLKRIPSKYFYDERGSNLFRQITTLPEYYLTSCELEILRDHAPGISAHVEDKPFTLIELGAGDGAKTEVLIRAFERGRCMFRYVPVDIAATELRKLTRKLETVHPELGIEPVAADYLDSVEWLDRDYTRKIVLFLGSSIGNMTPPQARRFLAGLRARLHDDDLLLIGFDLKKDVDVLLRAYNDSQGVTAEFNLNLLMRINRELGGDFDLSRFRHYEPWNPQRGAMESYLVSRKTQIARIRALGAEYEFGTGEAIHTEYSFKYDDNDIRRLASAAGFAVERQFHDSQRYFVDSLWRAVTE